MKKSFKVKINPEVLVYMRETDGWRIEEIAKKIGVTEKNYKKIELGDKLPTFKQLERIADCLGRPVTALLLPKIPEEPSFTSSFRILSKDEQLFSKEFRLAVRKSRYNQSILSDLMKSLGISFNSKIASIQDNPQKLAQEERRRMKIFLDEQFMWKNAFEAFNTWRSAIELNNILVFQFKFPIEDGKGFVLMDKELPVITINLTDNILARIFTLLHLYAHVILGITEVYTGEKEITINKDVEDWCDKFALEFLIPEGSLKIDKDFQFLIYNKEINSEILQNLLTKFKVNRQIILKRLKMSNLIGDDDYRRELANLPNEPGEFLQINKMTLPQKCLEEKGKQFISLVIQSREKGIINTHDVIEYLSIKLKHLDKIQELITI